MRGFNRSDTADGSRLGALFYYTNIVFSVLFIGSYVDLADVAGRLTVKRVAGRLCLSLVKVYISRCLLLHSGERRIKSEKQTNKPFV